MSAFESSKWIWTNKSPAPDEYGEFYSEFEFEDKTVVLNISADSNYAAYVNGRLAAFGQYADYPHDKIYDSVDITAFCRQGKNSLAVVVWYCGIGTTAVYCMGNAALMFEVVSGGKTVAVSSSATLSRKSLAYISHKQKKITPQLGFSFEYDANKQDGWMTGEISGFGKSVLVGQSLALRPRPNKKLMLLSTVCAKEIKRFSDTKVLFDLGEEYAGFLSLDIQSECAQRITVAYGEHIVDGTVRQIIGPRDFSVTYIAKPGENVYLNPFRRLGCRYLELSFEKPVKINAVGIAPTLYPLTEQERPQLDPVNAEIYDICVNTLKLCMHEHYEDCPWREQGLYTMDSRNQMLCGYYAFAEYEFARSCLELISRDDRADKLLSICYPKSQGTVIPSFSLHFATQLLEYYQYSKDISMLCDAYPKLVSVIKAFTDRLENGLVRPFPQPDAWNFYEWSETLDGKDTDLESFDLPLNALLSIALQKTGEISRIIGKEDTFTELSETVNNAINTVFYNEQKQVYFDFDKKQTYSQLGNCLAILCGAAQGERVNSIAQKLLYDEQMIKLSLSMMCFKYDAWLKADKDRYKKEIFAEIERVYAPMVALGNRTVWETEAGESDFKKAGSLCHGWSAMPIYYYNILKEN